MPICSSSILKVAGNSPSFLGPYSGMQRLNNHATGYSYPATPNSYQKQRNLYSINPVQPYNEATGGTPFPPPSYTSIPVSH